MTPAMVSALRKKILIHLKKSENLLKETLTLCINPELKRAKCEHAAAHFVHLWNVLQYSRTPCSHNMHNTSVNAYMLHSKE